MILDDDGDESCRMIKRYILTSILDEKYLSNGPFYRAIVDSINTIARLN
jgi:hypothetical protein